MRVKYIAGHLPSSSSPVRNTDTSAGSDGRCYHRTGEDRRSACGYSHQLAPLSSPGSDRKRKNLLNT